jgi:preprotein translocase subunit SecG
MTAFLVVLHILVSLFLILFVLLQPGARGGVGAAFGGAGGQTVFGGRGANTFLAKLTAAAAVIFMLTSITLSYFGSSSTSVMAKRAKPAATATDKKEEAKADGAADAAKPEAAKPDAPAADAAKAEAPAAAPATDGAAAPAAAGDASAAPK